ncbi:hypothetical protein AB0E96_41135, partial [Kitasatospora sp. NPDC036755]|uniref:hypothetical protein n=1 Tax=Kitasatospora sp. NPDC036755 TaxID=3154600 RepID=UPI00340D0E20
MGPVGLLGAGAAGRGADRAAPARGGLRPRPLGRSRYTLWQHHQLGEILDEQLTYWRDVLGELPQEL